MADPTPVLSPLEARILADPSIASNVLGFLHLRREATALRLASRAARAAVAAHAWTDANAVRNWSDKERRGMWPHLPAAEPPRPVTLRGGRRVARWLAAFPAARCRLRLVDATHEAIGNSTLAALASAAGSVVVAVEGCPNVTDAGLAALARTRAHPRHWWRVQLSGSDDDDDGDDDDDAGDGRPTLTLAQLPNVTDAGGALLLAAPAWRAVVFDGCARVSRGALLTAGVAAAAEEAAADGRVGPLDGGGAVADAQLVAAATALHARLKLAGCGRRPPQLESLALRGPLVDWPSGGAFASTPRLRSLELWPYDGRTWEQSNGTQRLPPPTPPPRALPPDFGAHLGRLRRLVLRDYFAPQLRVSAAAAGGSPFAGMTSLREATFEWIELDDGALAPLWRTLTHLRVQWARRFTGAGLRHAAALQRLTIFACRDLADPAGLADSLTDWCPRLRDAALRSCFTTEDARAQYDALGAIVGDGEAYVSCPPGWRARGATYKSDDGQGRCVVLRMWDGRASVRAPDSYGGDVLNYGCLTRW